MADGLTVPFALAAGVTGVVAASGIVVTAGLAEIVAGAISMGLGGYLAARSETAHYAKNTRARSARRTRSRTKRRLKSRRSCTATACASPSCRAS